MKFDTRPLLIAAARYALKGYLDGEAYKERREKISMLEGRLVTKESHIEAYQQSRDGITLDGTPLAFDRWRAEHHLLTLARAEAERIESQLRFEVELLERLLALAQQKRARAMAEAAKKEVRA